MLIVVGVSELRKGFRRRIQIETRKTLRRCVKAAITVMTLEDLRIHSTALGGLDCPWVAWIAWSRINLSPQRGRLRFARVGSPM